MFRAFRASVLVGGLTAVASQAQGAMLILEDFNSNEGHFISDINQTTSASNVNLTNTNTADRVTTGAIEGAGMQQLVVNTVNQSATSRLRHLSGGGTPANNSAFTTTAATDGWIGFSLKTSTPGWNVQLWMEPAPSGATGVNGAMPKTVIADGAWHVYEWNLDDFTGGADGWGNVAGLVPGVATVGNGKHVMDSIVFRNGATSPAQSIFDIDYLAINTLGRVSDSNYQPGTYPDAAPLNFAQPTQPAYVEGNYSSANTGLTFTVKSLDVLPGAAAILGPLDTIVLTDGPLTVKPGATFTGNGVVNGNIINEGLVRIPIVRLNTASNISGGVVQIIDSGVSSPGGPVGFGENTFFVFGGGGGGSGAVGIAGPVTAQGITAIKWDASLDVTGTFTQSDAGTLRLFIGGDDAGINYSQLRVQQEITLEGEIQIVLQPELFDFVPEVGDTFNLIQSPMPLSLSPDLVVTNFVTSAGQSFFIGADLVAYESSYVDDPDHLLSVSPAAFTYELVQDGGLYIFQATYIGVTVPEPSSTAVLAAGALSMLATRRRRHRANSTAFGLN